jgi:hypothetical protein
MAASALSLAGAIAAFSLDQVVAGVVCTLASAMLSLAFVEYSCTRHLVTRRPPITELPTHAPPLVVTVAQP